MRFVPTAQERFSRGGAKGSDTVPVDASEGMSYAVKEIFYSLQGEGANTGRPAVFCRFAGCNLWSGREEDRVTATCSFCDTDFVGTDGTGGGRFETPDELASAIVREWPNGSAVKTAVKTFVVCTGGEPLLQLDQALVDALHRANCEVAIETNGTLPAPQGIDWVCVSPKAGAAITLCSGDELKLVFPQQGLSPSDFEGLPFRHFFLQPMDGPDLASNTHLALQYCLEHPKWKLSLQTHKLLQIR
jgi:7-carboxy-7-deazaguanine synthase